MVSGPERTTVVCSGCTEPRVQAIFWYEVLVDVTRSAARNVRRSSHFRIRYCSLPAVPFGSPKRDRNTSGLRSWWSKTNFTPPSRHSSASAQYVSGGLHACMTWNRLRARTFTLSNAVRTQQYRNSHA